MSLGPELEAILAQDDTEAMLAEIRELFGPDVDVDSRFTIAQMIATMERSFRDGVSHANVIHAAFAQARGEQA